MKFFQEITVCALALIFILLMGVAFEKERTLQAKDQQIYELQRQLDEAEDLYGKAMFHIEMMNKERGGE